MFVLSSIIGHSFRTYSNPLYSKMLFAKLNNLVKIGPLAVCVFVCLIVSSFTSHSTFKGVTIADERMQIMTYARHLWPLSSEGSLACYTSVYIATVTWGIRL